LVAGNCKRDVSRCVIAVVGSPNLQGKVCALCSCVVSPIPTKVIDRRPRESWNQPPRHTPLCIRGFTSGRGGERLWVSEAYSAQAPGWRVRLRHRHRAQICLRVALAKSFGSMKRRASGGSLSDDDVAPGLHLPELASTPLPCLMYRRQLCHASIATDDGIKGRRRRRHDLSSSFKGVIAAWITWNWGRYIYIPYYSSS
jgi:hypothetical protein